LNFLEVYIRAHKIRTASDVFETAGFKTEARLLRAQTKEVQNLVEGTLQTLSNQRVLSARSMPAEQYEQALRESRRHRGKLLERIGKAQRTMLQTFRKATDSMTKTRSELNRREQIKETNRLLRNVMQLAKEEAQTFMANRAKQKAIENRRPALDSGKRELGAGFFNVGRKPTK